jgi:hypothetical protein
MWNLGHLFAAQGHLDEAKEMYSRARTGFQVLQGPSSDVCQQLDLSIASLDPTQGTHDNGGTRAGVDAIDVALGRNAKRKSRSAIGKYMRKIFR